MKRLCLLLILLSICSCYRKSNNIIKSQQETNNTICNTKLDIEHTLNANCNIKQNNEQNKIYFNFNDYKLTNQAKNKLNPIANWLIKNPEIKLFIEGHTDGTGTEEYNLLLGQKRAESVKEYLITKGIDKTRIDTISYGKEKPEFTNINKKESKKNRRAVINIYEE